MTTAAAVPLIVAFFLSVGIPLSFSLHYSDRLQQQQPNPDPLTVPGNLTSSPTMHAPSSNNLTCRLDLSSQLFAGVSSACSSSSSLDRGRCCPVLAAWLFAAHSHSAFSPPSPVVTSPLSDDNTLPLIPDDSQKCVYSLYASLRARNIELARPNATCDTVMCFCGIRLHQIGSLSCPAAFKVADGASDASPTAAVKELESDCRNSSYSGCSRCLQSLLKIKGGGAPPSKRSGDRAAKMLDRDCQLMGLTWLLAKNKTSYIPTVSAVIRAVSYSSHPPTQPYKCSPDQENMPLAVDSLQFQKLDGSSSSAFALRGMVYSFHVWIALFLSVWGLAWL